MSRLDPHGDALAHGTKVPAAYRQRLAIVRPPAHMATFHDGVLPPVQCFRPDRFRALPASRRGCGTRPRLESSTTLPRLRNSSSTPNSKRRSASFSIFVRSACKSPTSRRRTGQFGPPGGDSCLSRPGQYCRKRTSEKHRLTSTRHGSALRRIGRMTRSQSFLGSRRLHPSSRSLPSDRVPGTDRPRRRAEREVLAMTDVI